MTVNKVLFGKQLKKCRQLAKLKQDELAFTAGLSGGPSISRYEIGEDIPPKEKLDKMVNEFREKGVANEDLDLLYGYGGYSEKIYTDPLIQQVCNILEGNHEESKWLLRWLIGDVIGPLEKYQIGLTDMRRGENKEAQDIFDRLLPTATNPVNYDKRFRLRLLISCADARRLQGELHESDGILKEAETIARSLGDQGLELLAHLLKLKGNINRRKSHWEGAKSDFNLAIQAYRDYEFFSGMKQDIAIANLERKLAGTHLFQGQPKQALEHIEKSIKIYEELSDSKGKIQGLQHRAWATALLGHISESLRIHKDIIGDFETSKPQEITAAKGYRYLGDSYRMCGMPDKAIEAYTKAIGYLNQFYLGKAETDVLVYGTIDLGLGASWRAIGDFERANEHLQKSIKLHNKMGAKYYEAMSRRELGKLLLDKNDLINAEKEFLCSKVIFQELDNEYYLISLYRDMAELEYQRCNYAKARAYINNAVEQAIKSDLHARLIVAKQTLAKINLSDPDKCDPYVLYAEALKTANELDRFLVFELLCNITKQPYYLRNDGVLKSEILRLCNHILDNKEIFQTSSEENKSSLHEWLDEIDNLKVQIEYEISLRKFTNGRAVIVGVAAYQNMRELKKTIIDAQDLSDLLIRHGYPPTNITLLLDKQATKKKINNAMDRLARTSKPTDTVLFFFSGHGERHVGGFEHGEFICPVETDKDDLKNTAISSDELTNAIKSIPAKEVIVLLDACHSGGVGEPRHSEKDNPIKAGLTDFTYDQIASGEGRVVIASCGPNEYSWELPEMRNGLFSNYLLRGLEGDASDKEGNVRVLQLFKYISDNVPRHKSQHPQLKVKTDHDFIIISTDLY